jgi:hypothetical protein
MNVLIANPTTQTNPGQQFQKAAVSSPSTGQTGLEIYSLEVNGFGPALDDEEAAGYMAQFFRASDTLEGSPKRQSLRANAETLNDNSGCIVSTEVLETLGPAVTDEEMSEYIARCLA